MNRHTWPTIIEIAEGCPRCGGLDRKITHSRIVQGETRELRCRCLTPGCVDDDGEPTRYVVLRKRKVLCSEHTKV